LTQTHVGKYLPFIDGFIRDRLLHSTSHVDQTLFMSRILVWCTLWCIVLQIF